MGSITGAYLAAVIIAEVKALCIGARRGRFRRFIGQFLEADAGRRIPRDGGRADRAALRPARTAARQRCARSPRPKIRSGRANRRAKTARRRGADRAAAACRCWRQDVALCAGARHRRADRRAVRHQPALHHGPRRHAFVRPRRLFRPRRVWRGAAGEVARRCRCGSRSSLRRSRRSSARCCSAGSRCASPASISRC